MKEENPEVSGVYLLILFFFSLFHFCPLPPKSLPLVISESDHFGKETSKFCSHAVEKRKMGIDFAGPDSL